MPLDIEIVTSESDLEACLRLRHAVFVEEQDVPVELEIDHHDHTDAVHFVARDDNDCVATGRLVCADGKGKIGRLAVARSARGRGLGHAVMQRMIDHASQLRGIESLALDAQTYAVPFYEALGFEPVGEVFLDAGIEHIHMVLSL